MCADSLPALSVIGDGTVGKLTRWKSNIVKNKVTSSNRLLKCSNNIRLIIIVYSPPFIQLPAVCYLRLLLRFGR